MSYKPQREFTAEAGEKSVDKAGPETLMKDLDNINSMFDPDVTRADGSKGGISADNLNSDIKDKVTTDYLPLSGGKMTGAIWFGSGAIMSASGGDLLAGNFNNIKVDGSKILNVGTPVDATDAATKGYVDNKASNYVLKAGDTVTGDLSVNGKLTAPTIINNAISTTEATATNHLTTDGELTIADKEENHGVYMAIDVDADNTSHLRVGPDGISYANLYGLRLNNIANPTSDTDAATKEYVDGRTFVITETSSNGEWVIDKTYAEIQAAYEDGKRVYIHRDIAGTRRDYILVSPSFDSGTIMFAHLEKKGMDIRTLTSANVYTMDGAYFADEETFNDYMNALYNGEIINFTQTLTSGTEIGTMKIGAKSIKVYAPEGGSGDYLPLAGGTMTGNIAMGGNHLKLTDSLAIYGEDDGIKLAGGDVYLANSRLTGLKALPSDIKDATSKYYVDALVSNKADAENPVMTGSLSLNRLSGSTVGTYSSAEGTGTTASGRGSHAEGSATKATGVYSHAEGVSTTASGSGSHAEGNQTLASGNYQHVEGKYNEEDTGSAYAHIVGGGTSNTDRKNLYTLDWKGNAAYAGEVIAVDSDGNKHMLTEKMNAEIDKDLSLNGNKIYKLADPTDSDNAATKGYVDDRTFVITEDFDLKAKVPVIDKTYAEIQAAYKDGKRVYIHQSYDELMDYELSYPNFNNEFLMFVSLITAGAHVRTLDSKDNYTADAIGFATEASFSDFADQVCSGKVINFTPTLTSGTEIGTFTLSTTKIPIYAPSSGSGGTQNVFYGTCSTAAATAAKTATISGWTDTAGNVAIVKFADYTSVASPTLSINSGTAYPIRYMGTTAAPTRYWNTNEVVAMLFDGSAFYCLKGGLATTTYYGLTKLSASTSSTSTSVAATSSAVKAAYDLANGKADATHTHTVSDITDMPTIPTVTDIYSATSTDAMSGVAVASAIAAAIGTAIGGSY